MSKQPKTSKPSESKKPTEKKASTGQVAKKAADQKKEVKHLPFFLEAIFSVSKTVVILTTVGVAGGSIFSGSDLITIAVRTAGAIVVVGLLLWGASTILVKGYLEGVKKKQAEGNVGTAGNPSKRTNTMEMKA